MASMITSVETDAVQSPLQNTPMLSIDNFRQNIMGINTKVPLLDGSIRSYVNFDNAASTPSLKPVFDKVKEFMDWYSSVHRGSGLKSQVATVAYDEAHEFVYKFVNADPEVDTVIFGKNSTESLNKMARRYPFSHGDVVLTTLMEHHSNDLPWRAVAQVEHINAREDGSLDEDHFDALLKKYGKRVRLVVVTGASNVTGYINPVYRLAEKAHAVGAEILVDVAQLAPHRAIDMRSKDDPSHIDYVVLSAHKMYAPFGTGALVGKKTIFLEGDPDLVGGGTVDIVTLDDVKWAGLPDKEEAGSPNVVGAVAMAAAMLSLKQVGMDALAEHEARLTSYLLKKLRRVDGVKVFGITDPERAHERVGVVPFIVEGMSHYLVSTILSVEGGIGVRNGCFCAHPYLLSILGYDRPEVLAYQDEIKQGVKANLPGLVRVSFGGYNNEDEIDWFIELLERIVKKEYRGEYVQDVASGAYHSPAFMPEYHDYFSLFSGFSSEA